MKTKSTDLLKSLDEAEKVIGPDLDDLTGDKYRNGNWMQQHQVDVAAANPGRTQAFYNAARNSSNMMDQERYLARVFQEPGMANNIAIAFFVKEMRGNVTQTNQFDDISQELMAQSKNWSSDKGTVHAIDSNTKTFIVRDDERTPEEIVAVDEIVSKLYGIVKDKYPSKPSYMMVLTYLLIKGKMDHLIKTVPMAMYGQTLKVIDQIEKDDLNWQNTGVFCKYIGIGRKTFEFIVGLMTEFVDSND